MQRFKQNYSPKKLLQVIIERFNNQPGKIKKQNNSLTKNISN